jgi:Inner membrane component of T3SS, cytoplasmic domain/Cohesin domain
MKPVIAFMLAIAFTIAAVIRVDAQTAESIWLTASTTAYKTGETVIVTVHAVSATPIQGFTFQIRYDPACLRAANATSLVPGMNGLALPQTAGLVDTSYAGSVPQIVNGALAEVRFEALGACQTNLALETAALAIRNESGFAAPLSGVAIAKENIALNIDQAVGVAQPAQPASGATLLLDPTPSLAQKMIPWAIGLLTILSIAGLFFGTFKMVRKKSATPQQTSATSRNVTLYVKHGPQAGKSFVLNTLPCHIGRDPLNEICINDPHIISRHAQIFAADNRYYLADLGGETFINGQAVKKNSAMLKPGDVVRLGKSALFVFGS